MVSANPVAHRVGRRADALIALLHVWAVTAEAARIVRFAELLAMSRVRAVLTSRNRLNLYHLINTAVHPYAWYSRTKSSRAACTRDAPNLSLRSFRSRSSSRTRGKADRQRQRSRSRMSERGIPSMLPERMSGVSIFAHTSRSWRGSWCWRAAITSKRLEGEVRVPTNERGVYVRPALAATDPK